MENTPFFCCLFHRAAFLQHIAVAIFNIYSHPRSPYCHSIRLQGNSTFLSKWQARAVELHFLFKIYFIHFQKNCIENADNIGTRCLGDEKQDNIIWKSHLEVLPFGQQCRGKALSGGKPSSLQKTK